MKKSVGALFVIALVAGVLAACNGGGTSNPPGTGTFCGGPPNNLEVLFPIPGSKNVKPTLANIYVSTNKALPPSNAFNFLLLQSNGLQTFTSPFFGIKQSTIPTPHASPSYDNAVYYASSLPPSYFIGPAQTVSLIWNDGGTGCTPHQQVAGFTTSGSSR